MYSKQSTIMDLPKKKPSPSRRNKVGMFNWMEPACQAYIRCQAKKLGVSQARFIANCVGLAGPNMPPKFKFIFNSDTVNGVPK